MATSNKSQTSVPEGDAEDQAQKVTAVQVEGYAVDLSLDEGHVYDDPEEKVLVEGVVEGYDQGGVYAPKDTAVLASSSMTKKSTKTPDKTIVFTNTRYPEMKLSLVRDGDVEGTKVRTGRSVKFNSTKFATTDPKVAEAVEALNKPYIFREPAEFTNLDPNSDKFFVHSGTGFKTLVKKAYEDWVNNSEWSAKPS
jgi:hypothetical protein